MEKVKFNIAIQTYMEVFDYLINNGLFVFDSGKDFLKSRIKIGEYGFMLETQVARNTWDEKNPNEKLVPAIYVLNVLTRNIDEILRTANVPVSPSEDYAYINDTKTKSSGRKTYYRSYQDLLQLLKQVKRGQEQLQYTDGKIIDFNLTKLKNLSSTFSKLTPLEIRTIECYARLEEELISYTANLLMIDEDGYPVDDFRKDLYFRNDPSYPLRFASQESYVDWNDFKYCIINNYEEQLAENKFDLHGVYSPWDSNPYKSELGLDGKTK